MDEVGDNGVCPPKLVLEKRPCSLASCAGPNIPQLPVRLFGPLLHSDNAAHVNPRAHYRRLAELVIS